MKLELFPCSGGMAKGFRDAGVVFDMAFDKDPHACASYEANHGHRPIQMDVHDLLHMVQRGGWRPEERVELLVADPPCTPWSRAGKREGLEDPRDCLKATAELIRLLRPRAYLIGNVPGLQDSTSWHVVQDVIGGLAKHGYCVADYVSLDAADYGVPQHRIRPFWFGHLNGPCVRWPAPTHGAPSEQLAIGGVALKPWVTCRQALGHLSLEDLGRPVHMRIRARGEDGRKNGGDGTRCSSPDGTAKTVVAKPDRKGGQILITDPTPTTAKVKGKRGPNGGDASMCPAPDAPAKVVMAHQTAKGGQILLAQTDGHPAARPDAPSPTIRGGGSGHSAPNVVLQANDKHPPSRPDEPAKTITSHLGATGSAIGGACLAAEHPRHPINRDEPAFVVKTNGGRAAGNGSMMRLPDPNRPPTSPDEVHRSLTTQAATTAVLEWPWDRPATNVAAGDDRLPSPGHHAAGSGHSTQHGPNAVILSARAAAILQGFPEDWVFSGDTKKARWSQIGQAMPPGLAEPVARAIVEQMRAAGGERAA